MCVCMYVYARAQAHPRSVQDLSFLIFIKINTAEKYTILTVLVLLIVVIHSNENIFVNLKSVDIFIVKTKIKATLFSK